MLCQQRGSVSVDTLTFRRAAGRRLKGWKGGTWPARPSLALVSAACRVGSCTLLPRVISRFPPVTMWQLGCGFSGRRDPGGHVATAGGVRSWVRFNREALQKSQKGRH